MNLTKIYSTLIAIGIVAFNSISATFPPASADETFTSTGVTLGDNTGCAVTTYTLTQYVPNSNNAPINAGETFSITFPAGVDISSATMAGSSYFGVGISAGWTIVGQTLTFTTPVNVGKKKTLVIVIANVTNGNNMTSSAISTSVPNDGGGIDSATSYPTISTTVCPTPLPNDDCSGATSLTPAPAGSGVCTTTSGTTFGATASAQSVCAGQADDDVWYSFTANSTTHQVTVDGITNFNAVVEVFDGCSGTSLSCVNATGNDGVESANLSGLTIGQTYLVRVYHNGTGAGENVLNSFTICITSTVPPCTLGTGVQTAASLPFTSGALTTCGAGNDITSSNSTVCGSSLYYGGEDYIIDFTPTVSGNVSINLTSSGSWVGITLYEGCPTSTGTCVAFSQSSSGNQSIGCATVTAGMTYYLVVDSWPSPTCNPFNVTISAPTGGIPPGTTCSNSYPVTVPFSATGESTLCYGDDYNNSSPGSCNTLYESGEDKVYEFTTTGPDCFSLNLTNSSTSYIGYQVYQGCPSSGTSTCIANGGGASLGTLNGAFVVPAAGTYYLVIDTWASPSSVNYDIQLTSLGGSPNNDLPCNAEALTLGITATGDNNCSGGTNEPAVPGGWTSGAVNTVWYSVVIPASGSVKVRTIVGTLTDTQIAAYTGTCGPGLTFVSSNADVGSCGGTTDLMSELTISDTPGTVVYIRVDGENDLTGDFSILAIDGTQSFPGIQGQDCVQPNPVCNSYMTISNPGYSGNGNICDINSGYCLASGERNVVWYRVPIATGGTLNFDIVPNDFIYTTESETDYDFAVWKTADGAGGSLGTDYFDCSIIAAGTAPPEACNYSFLGVTGVGTGGNAPGSLSTNVCPSCPGGYSPTTTYDPAYEPTINAVAGDEYLIAVSNYSSSTSGFRIEFTGTAVIDYAAANLTNEVYWTGGSSVDPTEWTDVDNWGGCAAPTCGKDAFVSNLANQPVLQTGNTYTVRDVTIQAGATLTLQPNSTLQVCGDFYNYGSLVADPTSTIEFVGPADQDVIGNFTGTNAFGNFVVTKGAATGSVHLQNNVNIAGDFTTSNATSILNSNEKYVRLAGDFNNFSGNSTYTTTGTAGTLEFNGTGVQNYDQGVTQLDLNFVVMENTGAIGSGVNLVTDMFVKATTGTLTFNNGTITTGILKVEVDNDAPACVNAGNTNSYVDGNLRRYLQGSGAYNWPVGNVAKGYQLAYTEFISNTNTYIDSRFDIWPIAEPIQGSTECSVTYSKEAMNNGYWTLTATPNTASTYNMSVYPTNVTNIYAAWTIMKRPVIGPMPGWILDGTCVASTAAQVNRNGLSGFSVFGVAQSLLPLPIELLEFTGEMVGEDNLLKWETVSEQNNDYFTVERSRDGLIFQDLGIVDGAGNTNTTLNYQLYDFDPYPGITYYRLKQTDFDGSFSYSKTIALNRDMVGAEISDIYPNPASGQISFEVTTANQGSLSLNMYDQTGRLIKKEVMEMLPGFNMYQIDLGDVATGLYQIVFRSDDLETPEIRQLIKK